MVTVFLGSARRILRAFYICATLYLLYIICLKRFSLEEQQSPQKNKEKYTEVPIPSIYLQNIPNLTPHTFRYLLEPDYDVACGISRNGKARYRRDLVNVSPPTDEPKKEQVIGTGGRNNRPLLVLFLIHSKANHFKHRRVIRKTWGSVGKRLSKMVFLLGNPQNETLQSLLQSENKLYGDILQEDFYETYRNITLKAIMALKWASLYCPRAAIVTKADDDMFVGTMAIISNIIKGFIPRRKLLLCKPVFNGPVQREGKYAVSQSLYSVTTWPPFCFGGCWMASNDVIKKLYEISLMTPQIHLDDVYVTGILRTKIGQGLQRVANSQILFCHGRGDPNLVWAWWNVTQDTTNYFKTFKGREKIMDCFL
ncbi:beta-1,3-galactosyltransferase 5-like [Clavelina lepadiformis]|uniref:beta-1,3-galactosyltransferase 5-like n=1 Tax=Clavelina lepadiformis TaxID=159417 RepID=UPI004041B58D